MWSCVASVIAQPGIVFGLAGKLAFAGDHVSAGKKLATGKEDAVINAAVESPKAAVASSPANTVADDDREDRRKQKKLEKRRKERGDKAEATA